ncbi:MAG: tRNA 2-thiouridine(34) synthase MnmA [Gammaproteobacteria bacterium]|nr:tRNA 2-thiouridine(34) synthase MnmA [Gammaproteobacteria bacterium]
MSAPLVIVGLSGGVDSAVSAHLLLEAGYRVEGLHMTNWEADDGYCTRVDDEAEAAAVAEHLGIVLHRANFTREYREEVFADFLAEYRAGRTPNPDVPCNRHIKFDAFFSWARRLGADAIATGHYARVEDIAGRPGLATAQDRNKDQTYFLHAVPGSALARTLFPLGDLSKPEVRDIARRIGLPNHARKDSTGICFIGERPFREFLAEYLPASPGDFVDTAGLKVGRHDGLHFYTFGQRGGLGIGGVAGKADAPWYIIGKDYDRNRLIVAQDPNHPRGMTTALKADRLHWIAGKAPPAPARVQLRVRYRQTPVEATLESVGKQSMQLRLAQPLRAVTPGQYAVLYAGDLCLGGGRIIARTTLADGAEPVRADAVASRTGNGR